VTKEMDYRTNKQTKNGWKDNTTSTWRNKLQQNKNKKACEVSNPKIPIGLYIHFEYDCKKVLFEFVVELVVVFIDVQRVVQMEM
jgi:hypothetical protein